ncbi:MAG: glycerol kinase GlpK [Candidatus Limnocylindrales bacterium]
MTADRVVLALDQGTTSSRAIAFDDRGVPVAQAQREFPQGFPSPGHVTHDPEDIWGSQLRVAREVVDAVGLESVHAIGVANQRETTIIWDRATGRPVAPAIVWQSRITAPFCERLRADGVEAFVRERSGLPLDPYFSGAKIRHILEEGGLRARAERGELAFGTVDAWLVWRLTGGRIHATDVSNASRTQLLNLRTLEWDDDLLRLFEVPRAMLPEIRPSSAAWGETDPAVFGRSIPIAGVAGDQQAAMFGQACFAPGEAKNTFGTGAFLLANVGGEPVASGHGLLSTVLWRLGEGGPVAYALEGSVFIAGAAVQWLRDGLQAIVSVDALEALTHGVEDTGGVYVVPAFVGLGAPYWDPHARGLIIGLTRGTGLPQIARATVDSIAYQVVDVAGAIVADRGAPLADLRVDGGAARNDDLLRFTADLLGIPVERPRVTETTAWGAASLAGLATGVWGSLDELRAIRAVDRRFAPAMDPERRERLLRGWHRAVERSLAWAEG